MHILPKNIVRYDLLISCPGDVQSEIDLIKECVEEFNEKFSDTLGVMVQVRHWKKSSFSQSGDKPQELLNEQFVKECDAAVAVFWTRFGTPTDKYGSGTEEEIEIMLDAGRQVFMYFAEKPISPSSLDAEQYGKIKEFKEKYKDRGIYFTYSTEEEFSKLFFSHLTKYFLSKKQIEENEKQNMPNLVMRGISENGTIEEIANVRKFKTSQYINTSEKLEKIKQQYEIISKLEIEHTSAMIGNQLLANKRVEIQENVKLAVSSIAEQLSIALGKDFFDLGGLSENTIGSLSVLGRRNFVGGKNEKKKYDLINALSKQIVEFVSWVPIENAFNGINCVYLALENNGSAIDEDVEILLYFDKGDLLNISEHPVLDDNDAEYLIKECSLTKLLEIRGCADYLSYDDSIKRMPQFNSSSHDIDFLGLNRRDYQKEYTEAYEDALVYEIFEKGDKRVVKLQMDYIKHNSVIAFPAPLFLKGMPTEIKYQICSQHIPEIINGSISVSDAMVKNP